MKLATWEHKRKSISPSKLHKLIHLAEVVNTWESYEHGVANLGCPCSVPADETLGGIPAVLVFAWYTSPPEVFGNESELHHLCANTKCVRACHMEIIDNNVP